jgi:hypothetical protein
MTESGHLSSAVDIAHVRSVLDDAIHSLIQERKHIIKEFKRKLQELEVERSAALKHNEAHLRELGVKEEAIPPAPPLNLNLGSNRKLDNSQIVSMLNDFMEPSSAYSSSVLLDYLGISYRDFRNFVLQNPSFITGEGKNKGRLYKLRHDSR